MTIHFLSDEEHVCTMKDGTKKPLVIPESGNVVTISVYDENENDNNNNIEEENDDSDTIQDAGNNDDENKSRRSSHYHKNDNTDDDNDDYTTIEQRIRTLREEQQSIELARQLMAEEAMLSYHQHFQYLQKSADELSNEDYEALERALREDNDDIEDNNDDDLIHTAANINNTEYYDDNNDNDSDAWSYEAMLHLGERIGDVKTERWTMIAPREIEKLPSFQYNIVTMNDDCQLREDSEVKCLICQANYEYDDILLRLPCNHCFHKDCVTQWLSEKDVCPYCRTSIVQTVDGNA
jgi:Ring finger domain